jgi:hypothetical protein
VLDPHEGCLAELAGLGADRCQDDHGPAAKIAALLAVRRLIELGLLARPSGGARFVLAGEWHIPYSFVGSGGRLRNIRGMKTNCAVRPEAPHQGRAENMPALSSLKRTLDDSSPSPTEGAETWTFPWMSDRQAASGVPPKSLQEKEPLREGAEPSFG